jgi:hypothetical protein
LGWQVRLPSAEAWQSCGALDTTSASTKVELRQREQSISDGQDVTSAEFREEDVKKT